MARTHMAAAAAALFLFALGAPVAQAATVESNGTTATFTGDIGERELLDIRTIAPDTVELEADGDTIVEGANCTEVSPDTSRCKATERVVVDAREGDDFIRGDELSAQALRVVGGAGNDLVIGSLLPDELRGGPGNDTLYGISAGVPGGADLLDGGADDDSFFQPAGADEVIGASGSDRVVVVAGNLGAFPFEPANASVTLDGVPNDGRDIDGANVRTDVEHVVGFFTAMMENGIDTGWNMDLTYHDEGGVTARGTDGPNTVLGGTDGDDLDPLAGNDVVSAGIGDDRVNTVDGYADRIACGPGSDTLTADTLDDVSETCEAVQRTDVGNANDVPDVPEDTPPTVTLQTGATLVAAASDDRAVAAVQFLDDDRIVCTDDAAPYTCDYRPRGEDVGRNTLTAIAIDDAQQTASDRRTITVPKFAPSGVTLSATRRRASGRVVLPAQVAPGLGCTGSVALKVTGGGRSRAKRVRLKPDCTFSARLKVGRRARVLAAFGGNDVLSAKRSARRRAR